MDQSWKYSTRFFPHAPVIYLELEDTPIECVVDTGFAGGLLIPFPLFESIGLSSRLSPHSYAAVMPDARKLSLYTSKAKVSIGDSRIETDVHSSPSLQKYLIGRTLLESFLVKLDGKKKRLTLLK